MATCIISTCSTHQEAGHLHLDFRCLPNCCSGNSCQELLSEVNGLKCSMTLWVVSIAIRSLLGYPDFTVNSLASNAVQIVWKAAWNVSAW